MRAPPLGGPWVKMSVSASIGGTVPPPPPGPAAAALPPGSAARALHVELPSQQVTLRARSARKGIPWVAGRPRASGRPREVAGRTRRTDEVWKGRGPAMAGPLGDPAVRGATPFWSWAVWRRKGACETPWGPEPACHRGSWGFPCGNPPPYPSRNGPGEALRSHRRLGQRSSFLYPLAENPVATLSYRGSEQSLRFLAFTFISS